MIKLLKSFGHSLTCQVLDDNTKKLINCPNSIVSLSFLMSVNSIFQAITDYTIELISLSGFIFKIPLRMEFVFLTAISALLAYFTL
jgi:hypothetical protein